MATVDQELLFAIRGIEVLLESGVGVAEAMKHVAEEDYGDLSDIFQQIFKDTEGGKNFSDAIRTQMRKKILQDNNIIENAEKNDEEVEEERGFVDNFIEGLTATSEQFLIVSILIPIIVVIGAVVNGLVESAKASGGGFMGNTPTMPDACVPALFIIATVTIAGMIVQTKSKEPGV